VISHDEINEGASRLTENATTGKTVYVGRFTLQRSKQGWVEDIDKLAAVGPALATTIPTTYAMSLRLW